MKEGKWCGVVCVCACVCVCVCVCVCAHTWVKVSATDNTENRGINLSRYRLHQQLQISRPHSSWMLTTWHCFRVVHGV